MLEFELSRMPPEQRCVIKLFTTMPLFVTLGPEYLSPISFLKNPNQDTFF